MKERKWNFKEMFIILVIIFVIILLIVLLAKGISSLSKSTTSKSSTSKEETVNKETTKAETDPNEELTYKDYETIIKVAAERYENDHYQGDLESKETWVLSYKLLRENNYLKRDLIDLEDNDTECNGYVIFEKNVAKITYTPYIKCGKNYKTAGYDSSKINE